MTEQDEAVRCLVCGANWKHRSDYSGLGRPHRFKPAPVAAPPPAEQPAVDPGRILDEEEAAFADRILARLSPEPEANDD